MHASRLGELLVRNNLITKEQLTKALDEQKESGGHGRLGSILIKNGLISESDLTSFLSKQYGVPSINLNEFEVDPAVIKTIPVEIAQKYQIIPVNRAGSTLIIAMSDPSNIFAIDDIKFMTGYNVEVVVASETAIKTCHRQVLRPVCFAGRCNERHGDGGCGGRRRRRRGGYLFPWRGPPRMLRSSNSST